ncbi:hypothetical protein [Thiospirochaeta perfilievii]|nr:hypothetical protein [Thiospirochaeta perfilievii]
MDIDINVKENGYILLFKDSDLKEFTSVLWSIFEEKSKIRTIVETDFI